MIDHTGVVVSDFDKSKAFYSQVLGAIGYTLLMDLPPDITGHSEVAGFGQAPKPDFWITKGRPNDPPVHVAFRVPRRSLVDAFYRAAIAGGARDNGPPGIRAKYHPDYYGAFVFDPDGHNIEAVCHEPEDALTTTTT